MAAETMTISAIRWSLSEPPNAGMDLRRCVTTDTGWPGSDSLGFFANAGQWSAPER